MNELSQRGEVTSKELTKGKRLKIAAWTTPFVLTIIPFLIFFILFLFFGSTPPLAATFLFLGVISALIGFIVGLIAAGYFAYSYSNWLKSIRERIAVRGIRAEEVKWFQKELTSAEKKSLKEIEAQNLLLADAYRETLASRLTASRIIKSSRQELLLAKRRENKLKYLKSEKNADFQEEIKKDIEKLSGIKIEAEQMLTEAETRLQMIDAAARRGTTLADSELALKKLSARSAELPMALESARMEDEIRRELDKEEI